MRLTREEEDEDDLQKSGKKQCIHEKLTQQINNINIQAAY